MKAFFFTMALVAVGLPSTSYSYFTTEQSARVIANDAALYSLTYRFSHPSEMLSLPATALRDATSTTALSYSLLADSEDVSDFGTITTMIKSNAPETDGWYRVSAGQSRTFTLYALLEYDLHPEDEADYALSVTALPFMIGALENGLNPSELTTYQTPEIDLRD